MLQKEGAPSEKGGVLILEETMLSRHTQDGTNDDLISRFIVPELIDFKEAVLKYGGIFGIISTVLLG